MSYLDILKKTADKTNCIACMGLDPDTVRIPMDGNPEKVISKFFISILEEIDKRKVYPSAFKPNIAFFEQYGFEGLNSLKNILNEYGSLKIPVILDAKRGDIGKTSKAYAKAIFEFWNADATTLAPYMGSDSIGPFLEYSDKSKGFYILTRTSNKGAVDLQDFKDKENRPLFMQTAQKIIDWYKPGIGSVVGATYLEELKTILGLFSESGKEIALLIPGVGSQGASARDVMDILHKSNMDTRIHRINSSSAITYAFEKKGSKEFAPYAVEALSKLVEETKV